MAEFSLNSRDEVDVLIVGAGPAGGMAAKHLGRCGLNVVCLEQGEWLDPDGYPGARPEGELMATQRWHTSPNIRLLESDYPIDVSETDCEPIMFNGVGGSTILWGACWHRLRPSDFAVRSLDGVADDWPISYQDLVPYYEEAAADMAVSGFDGDPAFPAPHRYPLPALPIGRIGLKLAAGMNALGWHWWPGSNAIPSKPYRHLNACARLGVCMQGCPEGAKAVADKAFWIDAVAHGVRLLTGARAKQVTINNRGVATGVVWIDRSGVEHHQRAAQVILCANGIGSARLLLLSQSGRFPNGLANSSGLVGRNLMMHPMSIVTGLFDEPLESWVGPIGQSIYSMQFYESDPSRGFVRGAKWHLAPTGGPLANHPGLNGASLDEGWGANLHRAMRRQLGRSAAWIICGEDLPYPDNRIELSSQLTDSDGIPAVKVHYRSGPNETALRKWHMARASESMRAAGAVQTNEIPVIPHTGAHHLGTARMGDDPERSVTNRWGATHDVPNLHIYDGSLFVTSGGVNPTATICALSSRCVQHLIATRRECEVA